jgi:hypothetical protein
LAAVAFAIWWGVVRSKATTLFGRQASLEVRDHPTRASSGV